MSDKVRRTVTTIETHEVWIIRGGTIGPVGDNVPNTPVVPAQSNEIVPLPAPLGRHPQATNETTKELES